MNKLFKRAVNAPFYGTTNMVAPSGKQPTIGNNLCYITTFSHVWRVTYFVQHASEVPLIPP